MIQLRVAEESKPSCLVAESWAGPEFKERPIGLVPRNRRRKLKRRHLVTSMLTSMMTSMAGDAGVVGPLYKPGTRLERGELLSHTTG